MEPVANQYGSTYRTYDSPGKPIRPTVADNYRLNHTNQVRLRCSSCNGLCMWLYMSHRLASRFMHTMRRGHEQTGQQRQELQLE